MGCTQSVKQIDSGLPVYNMLVAGFAGSGKTTIINSLKGTSDFKQNELQITSFNVNNQFNAIAFQVAGRAHVTWHNYYGTANIVMFVVDIRENDLQKVKLVLRQMDQAVPEQSKMFLLINKMDLIQNVDQLEQIDQSAEVVQRKQINRQQNLQYAKIVSELYLEDINHQIFTFKCSAIKGQGIREIIKKLAAVVHKQ